MDETLSMSLANKISELPRLAEAVNSFLERRRLSSEIINTVNLALDELVANIILWGYDDSQEHSIDVKAAVDHSQVRIVIEDDGREFDPTSAPPPDVVLRPEERHEGGLGLHLVRTIVDKVTYQRVGGRNIVEVKVNID